MIFLNYHRMYQIQKLKHFFFIACCYCFVSSICLLVFKVSLRYRWYNVYKSTSRNKLIEVKSQSLDSWHPYASLLSLVKLELNGEKKIVHFFRVVMLAYSL